MNKKIWAKVGDEEKVKCPKCGHRARWNNTSKGVFYCFFCGDHGILDGAIPVTPQFNRNLFAPKDLMPIDYQRCYDRSDYPDGWDYLISRRINPDKIEFGSYGDKSRALFPVVENKYIVYWQSRDIYNIHSIKTDNPNKWRTGVKKSDFLYNYDSIKQNGDVVILVEGLFDSMSSDGVATLGVNVSDIQINKIRQKNPAIVLLCSDAGSNEEMEKTLKAFKLSGVLAISAILEDEDINELGYERFYDFLFNKFENNRQVQSLIRQSVLSFSSFLTRLQEKSLNASICAHR